MITSTQIAAAIVSKAVTSKLEGIEGGLGAHVGHAYETWAYVRNNPGNEYPTAFKLEVMKKLQDCGFNW